MAMLEVLLSCMLAVQPPISCTQSDVLEVNPETAVATDRRIRSERTWYARSGARLRTEKRGGDGEPILTMYFTLDEAAGRETGAVYFEGDSKEASFESFSLSEDRRKRTIRYTNGMGELQEVTEEMLDDAGRVTSKRFLRSDGTAYGEEEVRHTARGELAGWTFRRVKSGKTARFDYRYLTWDMRGNWTERLKLRDGTPIEFEKREINYVGAAASSGATVATVGWGSVSLWNSDELSPSFAPDGRMLFLRTSEDGNARTALLARCDGEVWSVTPLPLPHSPYTASFSHDGQGVFYSTRVPGQQPEITSFFVALSTEGSSDTLTAIDLSAAHGIRGSYFSEAASGTLYFFAADGADGPGIYRSLRNDSGYEVPEKLPSVVNAADALVFAPLIDSSENTLVSTRYYEGDGEDPSGRSGVYVSQLTEQGWSDGEKLTGVQYSWGAAVSPDGESLVVTDGRDLLRVTTDRALPRRQLSQGTTPTPREYLAKALDAMEEQSLVRDRIDWPALRERALESAKDAKTPADTYDAIRGAIKELDDGHSYLYVPDRGAGEDWGEEYVIASTSSDLTGRIAAPGVGYVLVPSFGGSDSWKPERANGFARNLQQLIRSLDGKGARRWIVDLRFNSGGNMWPMLAGVGPILGEGEVGQFVGSGTESVKWFYRNGSSGTSGAAAVTVAEPVVLENGSPRVAVLTSRYTTSSGEAIAVAFRARPGTRSFGTATGGASTATQTVWLGDGALLFLTTAVYADRKGHRYGGKIVPDVVVDGGPQKLSAVEDPDPVFDAALEWLRAAE